MTVMRNGALGKFCSRQSVQWSVNGGLLDGGDGNRGGYRGRFKADDPAAC